MEEEQQKLRNKMSKENEQIIAEKEALEQQMRDIQNDYKEQIGVLTEQSAVLNDQLNEQDDLIKKLKKD